MKYGDKNDLMVSLFTEQPLIVTVTDWQEK